MSTSSSTGTGTRQSTTNFDSVQQAFLDVAPKVTSVCSMLGCGWILLEVWVCSNKRYFVYHKLVSAMALYSLIACSGYVWSIANHDDDSQAACVAQGFLIQLQLGTILYFATLGLYYMLVISYSYTEDQLTRWEFWAHLLPALTSLGTAIVGLPVALDLYHPLVLLHNDDDDDDDQEEEQPYAISNASSSWCWIYPNPNEAEPPQRSTYFQWGFYLGPAWISLLIMLATLVVVFQGVQSQEQRMKKYLLKRHETNISTHPPPTGSSTQKADDKNVSTIVRIPEEQNKEEEDSRIPPPRSMSYSSSTATGPNNTTNRNTTSWFHSSRRGWTSVSMSISQTTRSLTQTVRRRTNRVAEFCEHLPRTRQVISQAMCYVGPLILSNLCVTLVVVAGHKKNDSDVDPTFGVLAFQAFMQPLQGFLIFLAYRRPTYLRVRRKGLGRIAAIQESLKWDYGAFEKNKMKPRSRRRHRTTGTSMSERRRRHRKQRDSKKKQMARRNSDPGTPTRNKITTAGRSSLQMIHRWMGSKKRLHQSEPNNLSCLEDLLDGQSDDGFDKVLLETPGDGKQGDGLHKPSLQHADKESASTIDTSRSSLTASKTGSSKKNEQPVFSREFSREASMQLADLIMSGSSENDGDDSDVDSESDSDMEENESLEADDIEQGSNPRPSLRGRFWPSQKRRDYKKMQQHSQRFFDLVCMDIIPEAGGATEEEWQTLCNTEPSYEHMGSERGNQSFPATFNHDTPLMVELPRNQSPTRRPPAKTSSNSSRLFAMMNANPLFKKSTRFSSTTPSRQKDSTSKKASPVEGDVLQAAPNRDGQRAVPSRTSSGGYFVSQSGQAKSESGFWVKLKLEKKRKEMLKAISQNRLSGNHQDTTAVGRLGAWTMARRELDKKRQELLEDITKRKEAANRNKEDSDASKDSTKSSATSPFGQEGINQFWSRLELDRKRQDILKSITKSRVSKRDLDHIPEVSEHEDLHESLHMREGGSEMLETSNELSLMSFESKTTVQHSNRAAREAINRVGRAYSVDASIFSSDEDISLVSDTPLDENFSDSGSESSVESTRTESEMIWEKIENAKKRQEELRASLHELQLQSSKSLNASVSSFEYSPTLSLDGAAIKACNTTKENVKS